MSAADYDRPALSLVTWSRDARPLRITLLPPLDDDDDTDAARFGPVDDTLFACSTVALLIAPVLWTAAALLP